MEKIHLFLVFLLICSSLMIFLAKNPVRSVLFLILTFANTAAILLVFQAEFLGLLFLIIYVGAIAILFLFVIMMLNVKPYENNTYTWLGNFFLLLFISMSYFFSLISEFFSDFTIITNYPYNTFYIDEMSNLAVFGQVLYNYYLLVFFLAGIILLIAVLGAVILTLQFKHPNKSAKVSKQLARTKYSIKS